MSQSPLLRALFVCILVVTAQPVVDENQQQQDAISYGVDVSFPIHYRVSTNYPWYRHNKYPGAYKPGPLFVDMPLQPLGNRQQVYSDHLESCRQGK